MYFYGWFNICLFVEKVFNINVYMDLDLFQFLISMFILRIESESAKKGIIAGLKSQLFSWVLITGRSVLGIGIQIRLIYRPKSWFGGGMYLMTL